MIKRKTKVVFVQLGSPKSLKTSDVRSYLREFLSDRRVIDLNPYFWKIILYLFILPFRPKESAKKYSRIYKNGEFPLMSITRAFTKKVRSFIKSDSIEVEHAFLLSNPRVSDIWDKWEKEPLETRATHLKVIPMFPQYSESTTVSGLDGLSKEIEKRVLVPNISVMTSFHNSKAFIDNCVKNIDEYLAKFASEGHKIDKLMISFHGIQKRRVVEKKDPYYR